MGEEAERSTCHARWQTFQEALDDMSNYSNSWRSNGTGWILKVTISTDNKNRVQVNNERVYENM